MLAEKTRYNVLIKPLLLGPGLFSILFLSCSFTSISVIHAKAFSQNDIPIILLDAKTEEPLIGVHLQLPLILTEKLSFQTLVTGISFSLVILAISR